jgi:hypothetical protein
MRKSAVTMLAVVGIFCLPAHLAVAAGAGLHPPQSAAEVSLNKIVTIANGDEFQLDNLLYRYPVVPKKQVDYRGMLTAQLIAAMQAEEKKLVAKDCGGKYMEGEVCGMDYSPITCAQDTVGRSYRTIAQRAHDAIVAGPPPHTAWFRWAVDGSWTVSNATKAARSISADYSL